MKEEVKRVILPAGLFLATFVTTTISGATLVYSRSVFSPDYSWSDFVSGMEFSVPLMLILLAHEFGHYFTAVYHKVKTSLPYFIPIPPIFLFSFGTLGAVILQRSRPDSNVQQFDIGVAGPVAGFVVALFFFVYALQTIPPAEHIYQFHPEYKEFGLSYADTVYSKGYLEKQYPDSLGGVMMIRFGESLMFTLGKELMDDPSRMPNGYELMHYPVLLACFIAFLITAMNLFPIGQLDGGHITYGLFGGKRHAIIARGFFILLLLYAGTGLPWINPMLPANDLVISIPLYLWFLFAALRRFNFAMRDRVMVACLIFAAQFTSMYFFPSVTGYYGWMVFAFIIGNFLGIDHPASPIEQPLSPQRVAIGWIALIIFVMCFMPRPFID